MASTWMIGINLHTWQVVVQEKARPRTTPRRLRSGWLRRVIHVTASGLQTQESYEADVGLAVFGVD